jgi:hypothetical protein
LALLPFEVAAAIWMTLLLAATAITVARLQLRVPVVLALGVLAMPILWTLAVGQAQALVTLFLTFGTPMNVALASHIKLTTGLVGITGWRAAIGGRSSGWRHGSSALRSCNLFSNRLERWGISASRRSTRLARW